MYRVVWVPWCYFHLTHGVSVKRPQLILAPFQNFCYRRICRQKENGLKKTLLSATSKTTLLDQGFLTARRQFPSNCNCNLFLFFLGSGGEGVLFAPDSQVQSPTLPWEGKGRSAGSFHVQRLVIEAIVFSAAQKSLKNILICSVTSAIITTIIRELTLLKREVYDIPQR